MSSLVEHIEFCRQAKGTKFADMAAWNMVYGHLDELAALIDRQPPADVTALVGRFKRINFTLSDGGQASDDMPLPADHGLRAGDIRRVIERLTPAATAKGVSERLFAWLGGYRDHLPPEAVTSLQAIGDELRALSPRVDGIEAGAIYEECAKVAEECPLSGLLAPGVLDGISMARGQIAAAIRSLHPQGILTMQTKGDR